MTAQTVEVKQGARIRVLNGIEEILPAVVNGDPFVLWNENGAVTTMIPIHVRDGNRNMIADAANIVGVW